MVAPYFFASRVLTALALASLLLALPTFGNSKPGLERWIEDFEWTESGWRVNGWEVTQDVECDPNQCVMRTSRCIGEWLRHIPLPPEKKEKKSSPPQLLTFMRVPPPPNPPLISQVHGRLREPRQVLVRREVPLHKADEAIHPAPGHPSDPIQAATAAASTGPSHRCESASSGPLRNAGGGP